MLIRLASYRTTPFSLDSWCQCYKTFFLHWWRGKKARDVGVWQASPTWCIVCRQGQKPGPRGEHLKRATLRVCFSSLNKCKNRLVRLTTNNKLIITLIPGVTVIELSSSLMKGQLKLGVSFQASLFSLVYYLQAKLGACTLEGAPECQPSYTRKA